MRFEGKTIFITGGARGIGEALARAFHKEGGQIAVADIDEAAAKSASAGSDRMLALSCDVASRASVEEAFAQAADVFGGIDILVNNAGLHTRHFNRPVTEVPLDAWNHMLEVNVLGVVNCTSVAAEYLSHRPGATVLNLSSVSGYEVSTAYGVTKLAIRGLTVALAQELAPKGIRVNGVAPGLVRTATIAADMSADAMDAFVSERQLIRRPGIPDDVAGAALFLCSDSASFITGETLVIGGGFARHV